VTAEPARVRASALRDDLWRRQLACCRGRSPPLRRSRSDEPGAGSPCRLLGLARLYASYMLSVMTAVSTGRGICGLRALRLRLNISASFSLLQRPPQV